MQAARRRYRVGLTLLILLGAGLRLLNAWTAFVHPDEVGYTDDACWTIAPISLGSGLQFLRQHPGVHYQLNCDTGVIRPEPTTGYIAFGGHLPLHAYVTGVVLAIVRPAAPASRPLIGRAVNVVADSATIALLPGLIRTLGGGPIGGLAAAALYAVFPPAIVYGSLANLDPFLAPLLVALLVLVLPARDDAWRWVLAGVVTGLLASAKQSGLLAFGLVPLLAWRHPRGLAIWGATSVAVLVMLVSPGAYLHGLRQPGNPYVQVRFQPVRAIAGNLDVVAHPSTWYWFSFSYHGRPLAIRFAHLHQVVTPLYLLGYALALPALVMARRWRAVIALFVPTVFLFAMIGPTNGVSRLHMAAPIVCAAIALAAATLRMRGRVAVLGLALAVLLAQLAPARLTAAGALDLGDLLFWNPHSVQRYGFYSPWRGRSLSVQMEPGVTLTRRLWLPPGTYLVGVAADGAVDVTLDDQPAGAGAPVTVSRVPRLDISAPAATKLRAITISKP